MKPVRRLLQGTLCILTGTIGIFGLWAYIDAGNVPVSLMFGVVVPGAFVFGVWLIRDGLR